MSIDARVVGIAYTFDEDGPGKLILEDRDKQSCRGQTFLRFDSAPAWVAELIEKEVWGSADKLIHGDQMIAVRKGYTAIEFTATTLHGFGPAEAKRRGPT